MTTLHLGVVDLSYTSADGQGTTTGDVAEYLEADYHVMEVFYELNKDFIADALTNAAAGAIESLMQGNNVTGLNGHVTTELKNALGKRKIQGISVDGKIEERFRDFLAMGEMQKVLPATQPIKAAVAGVSHRKKTPNAKDNPSRVAFVDTGLYSAAFRAWLD